jgi:hypothetical protein
MSSERIWRVRVSGSPEAVLAFLSEHPTEIGRVDRTHGRVVVSLFVPAGLIDQLRSRGLDVEQLYDASREAAARIDTVGKDNRFEGSRIPLGLGLQRRRIRS